MRKSIKLLIFFLTVIFIAGCQDEGERIKLGQEDSLIVLELTNDDTGEYQQIKEITDKGKIDVVLTILRNAKWEEASDKSRYPDFKINDKYSIWVLTPNNEIKVRVEELNKNTILSEKDSKVIYRVLVDEKHGS